MKLSKRIQEMQHSPIRKFYVYSNEAKKQGKKVYQLNIGQPDIKTPKAFMEAVRAYDEKVLAYAPSEGIPELIDAIRGYYARYGMNYDRGNVLITNGGSEALTFIMTAILDSGDEVIVPEPYYTNYTTFIGFSDGKVVPLTTKAEEGYHYAKKEAIEALITPRTRAMVFVNPGNPTGSVLTRDEMRMICDLAKKHDFFIIADEVYREFIYDNGEMTSFGQYEDVADRVIIVDSVSKRFSACGARIGSIVTKNEELYSNLLKLAQGRLCCPTIDQVGSVALYNLDPSYFNEIKAEYERRRNVVYDELCKIEGLVCEKPSGAFYITAKLPVENAEEFLIWMLTEFDDNGETVMFAPAEGFYGTPGLGRSEMRIAYVLNEKDMVRGVELIRLGLEAYNKR
ncbi:pyridoxal phosphate-dependent aminotransferase [Clostridium aminobutyricum]|uniref:Aminotransferase n=1 Tax=Clostridium aminobutyricum TaxID=33953 RepID=A0A939D885_CLOAM|nr:pyridoxal phosphate-dependent aminotransferase [Clostridium aminobutyricum]MBN7772518.1 pyridoxal phosphate-dependent aminotransferase [Clostridium aminobutyricum]